MNLAFDGKEFVCFLENIHDYLNASFEFIEQDYVPYPVGHLGDIEVRFVHFKSSEECVSAWERRKQRIDWDHIYIIATDADGLNSPDLLERFDKLPFRNKILFTSLNLPQYDWAITVKQFSNRKQVRVMTQTANFKGQRYYETCFDIAKWIANTNHQA